MGYYGIDDIKKHSWLKNMPWQKICKIIIKKKLTKICLKKEDRIVQRCAPKVQKEKNIN